MNGFFLTKAVGRDKKASVITAAFRFTGFPLKPALPDLPGKGIRPVH